MLSQPGYFRPGDHQHLDLRLYRVVTDITVPAATAAYYIILTVSTAAVTHSATPPTESADVIGLGVCDSNTRAATQELIIRQYACTDILSTGGGGVQRYKIQSVSTNYVVAKTWDGTNLIATAVNIPLPPRKTMGTRLTS